jgi:hypothetical protein
MYIPKECCNTDVTVDAKLAMQNVSDKSPSFPDLTVVKYPLESSVFWRSKVIADFLQSCA